MTRLTYPQLRRIVKSGYNETIREMAREAIRDLHKEKCQKELLRNAD